MPYGRAFPCTVSVDVSGLAAQGANRPDVVSTVVEYFRLASIAAIQFIGTDAKVTFKREVHKQNAMQHKSISVNGVDCEIRGGGGPRPQNVLISNFPYEIEDCVVRNALSFFGEVESVRFRHWTHLAEVCDGVCTVRMVRTGAIPRNLIIDGFPVKVSYVGQELECDICGKKGHIAKNCEMRGKCMECKQPGHFQRKCPVRRQRPLHPDEDVETLPDGDSSVVAQAGSADGAGSQGSGNPVLDVVSGPSAGTSDGPSRVPPLVVSPDSADSLAASQSILAAVTKSVDVSVSGESADSADSQMDTRVYQLDELNSQVPSGGQIGDAPNSPNSLSGAVVQTPNSVVEGSIGAAPNSSDSLFGAVVQTSNSDSYVDDSNSNSALNIANSKESSNIDKEDINANVYETSSEGLLSEEESSDNEMEFSGNVVHSDNESSANMEVVTKNSVLSVNIVSPGSNLGGLSVSSGGRPSPSKLPVAVGSKISKAPSAGVHKTASSRPAGLTPGLHKAALDWGVLSKRRK